MRTLKEHFNQDFKHCTMDSELTVTVSNTLDGITINSKIITITKKVHDDVDDSCRLLTYYLEEDEYVYEAIEAVINNVEEQINLCEGLTSYANHPGDYIFGNPKNLYSNHIYFYCEPILTHDQKDNLAKICVKKNIFLTIRGNEYVKSKLMHEKPLSFISHDSRDKKSIAEPIAHGLYSRLCPVWYDEFSLKPGVSLRESIEDGIKNAKKCILVLTRNFIENPGWTKKEFDSVFTREMIFNERVIIPIWSGVTKEEIYNYSPSLADIYALTWPDINVLDQATYKIETEKLISKLHIAITE